MTWRITDWALYKSAYGKKTDDGLLVEFGLRRLRSDEIK